MSAGLGNMYREDWDTAVGNALLTLNKTLIALQQYNAEAVSLGSTGLQALPSRASNQYSSADATALLNALGDADKVRQIYEGLAYLTAGSTVNGATFTVANNTTTFGYNFQQLNIGKCFGFGQ